MVANFPLVKAVFHQKEATAYPAMKNAIQVEILLA